MTGLPPFVKPIRLFFSLAGQSEQGLGPDLTSRPASVYWDVLMPEHWDVLLGRMRRKTGTY